MNQENKNKSAIALSYNPEDAAPKIIATGKGYLADKILKKASEHNIPVHKDEKLAGTLSKLNLGDSIPPELYEVVAEVLLFVDHMDRIKNSMYPSDTQNYQRDIN
jgi:flagellar biosynthesis protein